MTIQDETRFHENVARWSKVNPKTAFFLPYMDNQEVLFCETGGEENLKKGGIFLHDPEGPSQEAARWFQTLDLKNATVLYVYGVGLGYYYEAARAWLKENPKRALIFLEDDRAILHALFQTARGTHLLEDPQVHLVYFDDLNDKEGIFDALYWDFILTQMSVSALSSYAKEKSALYEELHNKIVYDAAIKNGLVEEYMKYGGGFFRNFYPNILSLPASWQGSKLFGKFRDVPAIICGAGPSLGKNIETLKTLSDRALIFGGGSSLNALSSHGLLPHFGIGIDPNPTQQYRLSSNKAYEVPLFYRNRMFTDAFRMIHGPRLYIPGAGGYDIAEWFDEKFDLHKIEWIDEGHNVVNFGLELAYYMGCNPIVFVGVDLAYTNLQSYAAGIVEDVSVELKEILETDDFDTTALKREDIEGRPIYTLWKWIAEANWIGDYAKEHPSLTIINSTEGGLGMPGIPNKPLKEVADTLFLKRFDLNGRVQGEILSAAMPHVTKEKVHEAAEELLNSMKRALESITLLFEETTVMKEKILKTKEEAVVQSGRAALAEVDLSEEVAYTYLLDIFNHVYSRILNKEMQRLKSDEGGEEWERAAGRADLNLKRLSFLRDVATVNISLLENAMKEEGVKW